MEEVLGKVLSLVPQVNNQGCCDKVTDEGCCSHRMEELMEPEPVDGEVRFLEAIDDAAC